MSSRWLALSLLLLGLVPAAGCTDTQVQPLQSALSNVDNKLTLKGEVCTAPPDPRGFPVKVVAILDQSGSMCVSDPPGSQNGSGFCEQAAVQAIVPPGVTEPARVRAMRKLVQQFAAQPNVQLAIVPFETNVKNVWPPTASGQRFGDPSAVDDAYLAGLQTELGKGTDYQGALAYAYSIIASDITQTEQNNPELLPRTRYVVVFLTDGTPYPRCSANDSLATYATPETPYLTWADSPSAGDFCNLTDPTSPDQITGFITGTDRNQNYQLFAYVDQLMQLKQQYNVGDIRFHTVLLFNQAAVAACGTICQDLYGVFPGVSPGDYPAEAKKIASWVLTQLAQRGNGVYQEFTNGEIQDLGLGALDYSSLASQNVLKNLFVQALRATPSVDHREVDSDGDGVPDTVDNDYTLGTNRYLTDSDTDCFDDGFEQRHQDEGFQAANDVDTRGCDPDSPLTLGCACRDTDGDGLSQFTEAFMKTRPGIIDSDGDGIPDGVEVRYGLNPTVSNAGLDTDGDGIPDADEIKADADPSVRDLAFNQTLGYQYAVTPKPQDDGSICYDFTVSNLSLVTPPTHAGVGQGFNLFKVYFDQAPESGVTSDYGVWKTACAWAQYAPPSVRDPAGPELQLNDGDFYSPENLVSPSDYLNKCVGNAP